ncbi:hypothetical protein BH23GEM6_BH23GEM6_10760 [soil metagenome]
MMEGLKRIDLRGVLIALLVMAVAAGAGFALGLWLGI